MIYNFNFTLKDTTPYGNVYFSRVFDIQGIAREMALKQTGLLSVLHDYKMITKEASNKYIKECEPFVDYEAECVISKIGKAHFIFEIEIRDQKTGEIHSKGWQKICFAKNGKLVAIPDEFNKRYALLKELVQYAATQD